MAIVKKSPKILMGIDPGTNLLGYAFIQTNDKKPRLLSLGTLDMRKLDTHGDKLLHIFTELKRLIALYRPAEVALEAPFFGKDVQAMLKLGRAQGVAMLAALDSGLPIEEYSPRLVKQAVTGKGNSSKEQVAAMLKYLIEGEINADFIDATDALAVAVCHHVQSSKMTGTGKKFSGWKDFVKDKGL